MATNKTPIERWLSSKKKDYQTGVRLYAEHPTAIRGLVNTLQRKENEFTRQKLVYALKKAAEADKSGKAKMLKKKGQTSARKSGGKARSAKQKQVKINQKKASTSPMEKTPSNPKAQKQSGEKKEAPADPPAAPS